VSCTVRVNDQFTPWFKVNAGVKQGCLIHPSLFAVYKNDLAQRINDLQCGIKIDDIFLSILLCADDIALIAPDELKLQQMLDVVTSWCSEWKLHINASKTQIVHFRNPSVQRSNFIFTCSNSNIEYVESYKYLGLWFDEHMNMNKAVRELAKSASRALGALYGKFVSCGGMTYSVFIKLYESTVEPILFYGSGIWGTKQYSVINNVQNKAGKLFLAVGKRTSNLAVRGDLGLMTCFNKQKLSCIRLISRLKRTEGDRLIKTVSNWASRRRKGWHETVSGFINSIECADVVNNTQITVKTVMRQIKDKMTEQDNDEFATELFNDRNQPNGNKLRTYRLYKENVNAEQFVLSNIPRSVRRTMALFRTGVLPLAIETGRYSRPQVHLNDKL
jgi:hypothetical protein